MGRLSMGLKKRAEEIARLGQMSISDAMAAQLIFAMAAVMAALTMLLLFAPPEWWTFR